jgi:hypothetical protein
LVNLSENKGEACAAAGSSQSAGRSCAAAAGVKWLTPETQLALVTIGVPVLAVLVGLIVWFLDWI